MECTQRRHKRLIRPQRGEGAQLGQTHARRARARAHSRRVAPGRGRARSLSLETKPFKQKSFRNDTRPQICTTPKACAEHSTAARARWCCPLPRPACRAKLGQHRWGTPMPGRYQETRPGTEKRLLRECGGAHRRGTWGNRVPNLALECEAGRIGDGAVARPWGEGQPRRPHSGRRAPELR